MSLSYYNPYDRYRRRFAERVAAIAVIVVIAGICAACGFWMGRLYAEQNISSLDTRLLEEQQKNTELQTSLTEMRAEAQTATMRYAQLEETYKTAVPAGPTESLLELVRKQLDEGMDPQRLEYAIRSARPPRNCTEPETKRFVIATPANSGPDNQVEIAEGAIVIKGSGASARNDKGDSEAWYDPSKNVALEFISADGVTAKKAGIMPLHHSVVAGTREYRFTVEEGARSFAKVTFDSCDYP